MASHSSTEQVRFMNEWFGTWSEFQKEDFVMILAKKLKPSQFINGLVNGLQNMNCSTRPPSLFSCQIKLFSEWWDLWSEEDRENFKTKLREKDSKFWNEIEGELDGTRKKLDEDFFLVGNSDSLVPPTMTTAVNIEIVEVTGAGDIAEIQSISSVNNKESNVTNGNGEVHLDDLEPEDTQSVNIPQTVTVVTEGEGDS